MAGVPEVAREPRLAKVRSRSLVQADCGFQETQTYQC